MINEKFNKDANQYEVEKTKISQKSKAQVRYEEEDRNLQTYSATSKSHLEISYLEVFNIIINTAEKRFRKNFD